MIGWLAVSLVSSGNIASQTLSDSQALKRMLQDADLHGLIVDGKPELDLSALCPGKTAYIRYDRQVVTEMRICLFADEVKQPSITPVVYDFVERYLLGLLLRPTKKEQIHQLREDFCRLSVNGKDFGQTSYTMSKVLQAIQKDSPLSLQNDSLLFTFRWNGAADNRLPEIFFIFPKQYDLIAGKDKKEIVHHLYKTLKAFEISGEPDSIPLLSANYRKDKDFYSAMEEMYLIPQVKGGTHFFLKDSVFHYLLNERFAEESLVNLFGYADVMGYSNPLELEVKGYRFSETLSYTLKQLTAFLRKQHYRVYLGLEEWNEKEYTGTVFYINRDLMCKHLLYFHFPKEAFKRKQVPVRAVLYPFIPIQNIGTLYDKDTKTEGKNILVK